MMERLTGHWVQGGYAAYDPIDILDNDYSKINYHKLVDKLGEYEDLEEQGLLLRVPCKVGDTIDKLFSHNEFIALWYDEPSDKDHSYLLWKGMAHQLPKKYKNQRILRFKGIIPERFIEADTINLLVTPYIVPCEEAEAKLKELESE